MEPSKSTVVADDGAETKDRVYEERFGGHIIRVTGVPLARHVAAGAKSAKSTDKDLALPFTVRDRCRGLVTHILLFAHPIVVSGYMWTFIREALDLDTAYLLRKAKMTPERLKAVECGEVDLTDFERDRLLTIARWSTAQDIGTDELPEFEPTQLGIYTVWTIKYEPRPID